MNTQDHDFVECPFCGSNRAVLIGVEQDGLHEMPPSVAVIIECLQCDHHYGFDVAQATEQVHVGLYGFTCPEGCPDKGRHQKR